MACNMRRARIKDNGDAPDANGSPDAIYIVWLGLLNLFGDLFGLHLYWWTELEYKIGNRMCLLLTC